MLPDSEIAFASISSPDLVFPNVFQTKTPSAMHAGTGRLYRVAQVHLTGGVLFTLKLGYCWISLNPALHLLLNDCYAPR